MRHAVGLFAIPFAFAATVFAEPPKQPPQAPPPAPKDASALSDHTTLLAPIQVDSLTLTPIVATATTATAAAKDAKEDLLVLDEAMAQNQVKIREIADGSVNSLTFVN